MLELLRFWIRKTVTRSSESPGTVPPAGAHLTGEIQTRLSFCGAQHQRSLIGGWLTVCPEAFTKLWRDSFQGTFERIECFSHQQICVAEDY